MVGDCHCVRGHHDCRFFIGFFHDYCHTRGFDFGMGGQAAYAPALEADFIRKYLAETAPG